MRQLMRIPMLALLAACNGSANAAEASRALTLVEDSVPTPVTAPSTPAAGTTPASALAPPSASAVTFSGTLVPRDRAVLRAELGGPIATLAVRVGDRVARGAALATIAAPAVGSAAASAAAQVMAAQAAVTQLRRELDRVTQLLAIGGAARAEREELESRLLASEAALAAARAQQAAADAERARRTIRAPFAGIIERRTAAPGSMVQPGDEVLTLVDARTLELEAALPADASPRVRVGARVRASTSGAGAPALTGTIVRIAPALDPVTRQLRVTIAIANPQGRLPIGAFVEGTLVPADSLGGR